MQHCMTVLILNLNQLNKLMYTAILFYAFLQTVTVLFVQSTKTSENYRYKALMDNETQNSIFCYSASSTVSSLSSLLRIPKYIILLSCLLHSASMWSLFVAKWFRISNCLLNCRCLDVKACYTRLIFFDLGREVIHDSFSCEIFII